MGIVALPLAIAFGIASGVSPEKGIVTAIVAGFIISFLGGSKVQIGGPTGAFIVIIYGIIQEYGIEGLMVATMMAGVLLIVLGVFRLGTVIKFIPYPIIVGFTSGIAVTIFTTQIADIFGLDFGGEKIPGDFIGKWMIYFRHFDTVNWWNAAVSMVSIVIIALTPKFSKKIYNLVLSDSHVNYYLCPQDGNHANADFKFREPDLDIPFHVQPPRHDPIKPGECIEVSNDDNEGSDDPKNSDEQYTPEDEELHKIVGDHWLLKYKTKERTLMKKLNQKYPEGNEHREEAIQAVKEVLAEYRERLIEASHRQPEEEDIFQIVGRYGTKKHPIAFLCKYNNDKDPKGFTLEWGWAYTIEETSKGYFYLKDRRISARAWTRSLPAPPSCAPAARQKR